MTYLNLLNRNELLTTQTELSDMAAAAKTGFKRMPIFFIDYGCFGV